MGNEPTKIAILTSGGDAQGMNAVVRAAVRTAIHEGAVPTRCARAGVAQ